MSLMLYLDDAMKVLLQNDYIDIGYIDDDGGSEIVRNELEQKCYLREPVDIVRCKDCKHRSDEMYDYYGNPNNKVYVCQIHDLAKKPDWFCADGERESDNG